MTQIINLNKQRKAKAKADKEKSAKHNRVKFGRTKAEKQGEAFKLEKLTRLVEAHKLEKDDQ